jgi:hypothetical protein
MKRCKHLGCRLAGMRSCQCFGGKVQRSAPYVVWATPAHPEKPWAVGHEIRPGCLKVVAYAESKLKHCRQQKQAVVYGYPHAHGHQRPPGAL